MENMKYENNIYTFSIKGKEIEVFLCKNGNVEMYEKKDPNTGFYFNDLKEMTAFCNGLCDIVEHSQKTGVTKCLA